MAGFDTLLAPVTDEQIKKLPSRLRNRAKIEAHLTAFALHLQGCSHRGICEELGYKSTTASRYAISKGEQIAKTLGIDLDRIRLKIAARFEEIIDAACEEIKIQQQEGRVITIIGPDGSQTVKVTKGVDAKMVAEATRGLTRLAQFHGIGAQGQEVTMESTTVISLTQPLDGGDFESRYGAAVDASATRVNDDPNGHGSGHRSTVDLEK